MAVTVNSNSSLTTGVSQSYVDIALAAKANTSDVTSSPVWTHPLGLPEMVGDATYVGFNKTGGFYETFTTSLTFNQIKMRLWATNSTTAIEWKLFIRPNTSSFNMQSTTPTQSGTIASGGLQTVESEYVLNLSDTTVSSGQSAFILFKAVDGTAINHKRWLYNSSITPARHGFILCTTSDWNQVWSLAGQTLGYGQAALQFLYEPLSVRNSRIASNISYSATTSGLAASTVQQAIDVLSASSITPPEIIVPTNVFGVQGRETNIYFDNTFVGEGSGYITDSNSSYGINQSERWTFVPTGALNSTIGLNVIDKRSGSTLVSKTVNLLVAPSTAGTGLTKKVLFIGDSLISAGTITQTMLDIVSSGDAMGVTLLGTQGTSPNKHEGRGGWTVSAYTTAGFTYYTFTVTGVVTAPSINATEYTHNGSTYRVQAVNLSSGSGTITCSVQSGGAPLSTGALTKSNAVAGDATIAFTASAAVPANPFWFSGAVNFAQYLSTNSIATPDWVFIQLGINDVFAQVSDSAASTLADTKFTSLDILINSIKAADANVKIGVVIPPPPAATQDAFGANYLSGESRWRHKRNILIWARQLLIKYQAQEANRIYVVPANLNIDCVNNFPVGAASAVNSRNTTTVVRQSNGVHPATSGYQQLGDAIWSFMKYYA